MNLKISKKFENETFLKIRKKIYDKQNFNCLVFFKTDRPVCSHLNVNLIKTTLKTIFSFKNRFFFFAFLTPKTLK